MASVVSMVTIVADAIKNVTIATIEAVVTIVADLQTTL
jgi:hypothetical protein